MNNKASLSDSSQVPASTASFRKRSCGSEKSSISSERYNQESTSFNDSTQSFLPSTLAECSQDSNKSSSTKVQFSTSGATDVTQEFTPFISEGFISLPGDSTSLKPIKILRDTGASQSLLLEGVLPLSKNTATGSNIL